MKRLKILKSCLIPPFSSYYVSKNNIHRYASENGDHLGKQKRGKGAKKEERGNSQQRRRISKLVSPEITEEESVESV